MCPGHTLWAHPLQYARTRSSLLLLQAEKSRQSHSQLTLPAAAPSDHASLFQIASPSPRLWIVASWMLPLSPFPLHGAAGNAGLRMRRKLRSARLDTAAKSPQTLTSTEIHRVLRVVSSSSKIWLAAAHARAHSLPMLRGTTSMLPTYRSPQDLTRRFCFPTQQHHGAMMTTSPFCAAHAEAPTRAVLC